jgi:hypothetical protein
MVVSTNKINDENELQNYLSRQVINQTFCPFGAVIPLMEKCPIHKKSLKEVSIFHSHPSAKRAFSLYFLTS